MVSAVMETQYFCFLGNKPSSAVSITNADILIWCRVSRLKFNIPEIIDLQITLIIKTIVFHK